jgi:hypothetical protein
MKTAVFKEGHLDHVGLSYSIFLPKMSKKYSYLVSLESSVVSTVVSFVASQIS